MPESHASPKLFVEGNDDMHAIRHLLIRHGINLSVIQQPCEIKIPSEGKTTGSNLMSDAGSGVEVLLAGMEKAVEFAKFSIIGFVLDADSPLQSRWDAVKNHLKNAGVSNLPKMPPQDGFNGKSETYQTKVGVWLMPDNQTDGTLESFLKQLIDEKDSLIDHAISTTKEAKNKGAEFIENDTIKAELHAWLAWQREPGKQYGTAICARFFKNDFGPTALAFVAWFKQLYEIA